ncbi:hypothetical protein KOR42_14290 [Thalassoglobus neptunius]|uniref:Uncharacterized protein n=1 Tax=Thalassoglobus neptunius TaxID=1938619 RepID=A0A5C5X5Z6_9PLAN|nr:hypothetical protein KOR42_14290 [Thalassoglobus neptunius]
MGFGLGDLSKLDGAFVAWGCVFSDGVVKRFDVFEEASTSAASLCRSALRYNHAALIKYDDLGFRVALSHVAGIPADHVGISKMKSEGSPRIMSEAARQTARDDELNQHETRRHPCWGRSNWEKARTLSM